MFLGLCLNCLIHSHLTLRPTTSDGVGLGHEVPDALADCAAGVVGLAGRSGAAGRRVARVNLLNAPKNRVNMLG